MKLKYFILLSIISTAALYLYLDEPLRNKLLGQFHKVVPELNQSTLYKWKNKQGEWQITDMPPRKGISFTTINTQDQVNVMPSLPTQEKKK